MTLVVDTSALVAVVLGESDAEALTAVMLRDAGDVHVSAVSRVEAAIVVMARQGVDAVRDLDALIGLVGAITAAVDADQAQIAVAAWRRFGKRRHPAGLNFGDCFSYALAKKSAAPMLFKGDDFAQTDVARAS